MRALVASAVASLLLRVRRSPAAAAVVLGVVVVLALVIFVLPPLLADEAGLQPAERVRAENDVRSTLLQALAGAVLAAGLYFTAQTLQLNRRGQITDRFTKAIDQLGDDKLDVRLGGIYALERIAKDSKDDHGPVMEVLTAFLREHSRSGSAEGDEKAERSASGSAESGSSVIITLGPQRRPLRTDLQAAASVVARRVVEHDRARLDLYRVNLEGLVLGFPANFSGADLSRANLADASLPAAELQNANLSDARLTRADLRTANLKAAFLPRAELEAADLRGAKLERAYLAEANFKDANVGGAVLKAADLRDANLANAYLAQANLSEADLTDADLTNTTLEDTDLRRARIESAKNVTVSQFKAAITDTETAIPELHPDPPGLESFR